MPKFGLLEWLHHPGNLHHLLRRGEDRQPRRRHPTQHRQLQADRRHRRRPSKDDQKQAVEGRLTHAAAEPLTVAILVGGRGSRMGGVDKASLELDGRPLLDRVLEAVAPLAAETFVVANDDRLAGDPRFTGDPRSGAARRRPAGPAGGAGRRNIPAAAPARLRYAVRQPRTSWGTCCDLAATHDAVMPYVQGFPQPMHAVYRVAPCREAVRNLLADESGGRRMISFLDDVNTLRVPEDEIRKIDPEIRSFFNVNTPYDLEAARHLLERQGIEDRLQGKPLPVPCPLEPDSIRDSADHRACRPVS